MLSLSDCTVSVSLPPVGDALPHNNAWPVGGFLVKMKLKNKIKLLRDTYTIKFLRVVFNMLEAALLSSDLHTKDSYIISAKTIINLVIKELESELSKEINPRND